MLLCPYMAAFTPSLQRNFQTLMVYHFILCWQDGHMAVWELRRHKAIHRVVGH